MKGITVEELVRLGRARHTDADGFMTTQEIAAESHSSVEVARKLLHDAAAVGMTVECRRKPITSGLTGKVVSVFAYRVTQPEPRAHGREAGKKSPKLEKA